MRDDARRRDFGVALSGGGVRASAFVLGALLYLVDSGLNRRVGVISSVSGASLTNGFLLARAEDFGRLDPASFDPIARELIRRLRKAPVMGVLTFALYVPLLLAGLCCFSVAFWAWPFDASPIVRASLPFAWGAAFLFRGRIVEAGIRRFLKPAATVRARSRRVVVLLLLATAAWWVTFVAGWPAIPGADGDWRVVAALVLSLAVVLIAAIRHRRRLNDGGPVLGRARPGSATTHVFCATDLVIESPLFLVDHGGGWAYSRYGWARASRVPLATAVRASAALPGAFPPRALRTSTLAPAASEFTETRLPRWFHLSDGGVWDNLGTQWFGEKGPAASSWDDVTGAFHDAPANAPPGEHDIRRLLVVDGRGWGTGFTHKSARYRSMLLKMPLLAELVSLGTASSIQYENTVEPRTRAYAELLRLQIDRPATRDVLAGVATLTHASLQTGESEVYRAVREQLRDERGELPDELDRTRFGSLSPRFQSLAHLHEAMRTLLDTKLSAAEPEWLAGRPSSERRLSNLHERCARVGTKLWWLSAPDAMALVIHGYVQTMGAASVLIALENGEPGAVPLDLPGLDRFERLLAR